MECSLINFLSRLTSPPVHLHEMSSPEGFLQESPPVTHCALPADINGHTEARTLRSLATQRVTSRTLEKITLLKKKKIIREVTMLFDFTTIAAVFLLLAPARSAPTGPTLPDACAAVQSSSLELNRLAKEASLRVRFLYTVSPIY